MGKRTTAQLLKEACAMQGLKAEIIYTGQTGWMQGHKYGFIFDSTLNDFVSGELSHAIVSCWKNEKPDIIFLEGQSSLRNPSGPCGSELLISGNAKKTILLFEPDRAYFDNDPDWGTIPSIESEIELIRCYGSEVNALAMNTHNLSFEDAKALQLKYETSLKIPVALPIEEGVSKLIAHIIPVNHEN